MSAIYLYAKSKSGHGPHEVNVDIEDGVLLISCTCPAGERQQLCRHLTGIASGNPSTLETQSSEQLAALNTAHGMIGRSSCANDIRRLLELEQAAAELKIMKQKVVDGLTDGFPLSS
jgi:uncharacterized Zn finger protein